MAAVNPTLLSWGAVEAQSDLEGLRLALDYLPDRDIIEALQAQRGLGRNNFPIATMWNALLASIVFQHASVELLLRELQRNPALAQACGFDTLPIQKRPAAHCERDERSGELRVHWSSPQAPRYALPDGWNMSRFLTRLITLEEEQNLVSAMITHLREQLMAVLPDFGCHLGYDGKAIDNHSTGRVNKKTDTTSDPEADWASTAPRASTARPASRGKKSRAGSVTTCI